MSEINQLLAGRYRLNRLIGQGGMADVYLANDEILNRVVAVKLLRSSLTGDPIYITRFHREASAAALLSHPNIVAIYDVGDEDDIYFIVMEYVKGQTLKSLIHKRGALHFVEAIDIMKQVVSGTALAHENGIIHRDLKPQNILVTDSGNVKIADFGIASIQSLTQVTQSDTIMGSLHYLAPEIARGEKATAQSDIYALGIVFYELLRGEVPFNGESPVNIALKHMRDEIPCVRDFNPSIPQSVENIIIKATAKNISDRYQDANEMLRDLSTCLDREDEEKLDFSTPIDEPTIVVGETQFYKTEEVKPKFIDDDDEEEEDMEATKQHTITPNHRSTIITPVKENKTDKKKKKKKIILITSIIVLLISLTSALGYYIYKQSTKTYTMINVVGIKKDEAIKKVEAAGFTVDTNYSYELSDQYEKDYVIETSPKSGDSIAKKETVHFTISSGKYLVMEDYTGKTYDEAYAALTKLGYTVKKYEKSDEEYSKGMVIDQSISPGEKQDPNSDSKQITLTVSKGVTITVPYLYGESIDSAKSTLTKLGFKVTTEVLTPPTDENEIKNMTINTVVKMSLEPYTQVHETNTPITLYYYKEKPELPSETTNNTTTDTTNNTTNTTDTNTNNNGNSNGNGNNNKTNNENGNSNSTQNTGTTQ